MKLTYCYKSVLPQLEKYIKKKHSCLKKKLSPRHFQMSPRWQNYPYIGTTGLGLCRTEPVTGSRSGISLCGLNQGLADIGPWIKASPPPVWPTG